jgi:hypothetical protein
MAADQCRPAGHLNIAMSPHRILKNSSSLLVYPRISSAQLLYPGQIIVSTFRQLLFFRPDPNVSDVSLDNPTHVRVRAPHFPTVTAKLQLQHEHYTVSYLRS